MDNPIIEFDGKCAFAVSTGKLDVNGGNKTVKIKGKEYVFSNPVAQLLFRVLPNRIEKAEANWKNQAN